MLLNVLLFKVTIIAILIFQITHGDRNWDAYNRRLYIFKPLNNARLIKRDSRFKREPNVQIIVPPANPLPQTPSITISRSAATNQISNVAPNSNVKYVTPNQSSGPPEVPQIPPENATPEVQCRQKELHEIIQQLYQAEAQVQMEADEIQRCQQVAAEAEQALADATTRVQSISAELQIAQEAVISAGMQAHSAQLQLAAHDQLLFTARQKVDSLSAQMVGLQAQLGLSQQKLRVDSNALLSEMQRHLNSTEPPPTTSSTPPTQMISESTTAISTTHAHVPTPAQPTEQSANATNPDKLFSSDIMEPYLALLNAIQKAEEHRQSIESPNQHLNSQNGAPGLDVQNSLRNASTAAVGVSADNLPTEVTSNLLPDTNENGRLVQPQWDNMDVQNWDPNQLAYQLALAEANALPQVDKELRQQQGIVNRNNL